LGQHELMRRPALVKKSEIDVSKYRAAEIVALPLKELFCRFSFSAA
jgi:hypothetical protein